VLVREVQREAGARDDSSSNAQLRRQKHPSDMKALAQFQLQTYMILFASVAALHVHGIVCLCRCTSYPTFPFYHCQPYVLMLYKKKKHLQN
jgi:hypothetical protein